MTTVEAPSSHAPTFAPPNGLRLIAAAPSLWRVVEPGGRIIGHLQAVTEGEDVRFRARRWHPVSHAFLDLGEFWRPDDAVDCLRFAT